MATKRKKTRLSKKTQPKASRWTEYQLLLDSATSKNCTWLQFGTFPTLKRLRAYQKERRRLQNLEGTWTTAERYRVVKRVIETTIIEET